MGIGKPFIKALIVGLLFVVLYYAAQMVRGMYLTTTYVPDIIETYQTVDHLEHKVTFGLAAGPLWGAIEGLALMLLGVLVYYTGRRLKRNRQARNDK